MSFWATPRPLPFRENVDFLRLSLAILLVVTHGLTALSGIDGASMNALTVTSVFFFLSGFYTYRSFEARPEVGSFLKRRYLRAIPIPLITFGLVSIVICATQGIGFFLQHPIDIGLLILALLTLYQPYWPTHFEQADLPVDTAALWFVAVILVYVLLVPLLHRTASKWPWLLAVMTVLSAVIFTGFSGADTRSEAALLTADLQAETGAQLHQFLWHLFRLVGCFWMFAMGIYARRYWNFVSKPKVALAIFCASIFVTLCFEISGLARINGMAMVPVWFAPGLTVLWLGVFVALPRLPKIPDFSVSLYLIHPTLFAMAVWLGLETLWSIVPAILVSTIALHFWAEKPLYRLFDVDK